MKLLSAIDILSPFMVLAVLIRCEKAAAEYWRLPF